MTIELLWIIVAFAVGSFLFLIAFLAQKSDQGRSDTEVLSDQLRQYNSGNGRRTAVQSRLPGEKRISEIESKISMLNTALLDQQRMVEKFQKENVSYNSEIKDLRTKLRELHREYDIVISENFSLRAKVKKLKQNPGAFQRVANGDYDDGAAVHEVFSIEDGDECGFDMHLHDDTRKMEIVNFDDTGEIDLTDLK